MTTPGKPDGAGSDDVRADDESLAFVAKLASHYSPEPMSDGERRAFDRSLSERLASRHRTWRNVATIAAAATAAALALIAAPGLFLDTDPPAGGNRAEAFAAAEWESQLFDTSDFDDSDAFDELDDLPDDYVAIAGLLLGG